MLIIPLVYIYIEQYYFYLAAMSLVFMLIIPLVYIYIEQYYFYLAAMSLVLSVNSIDIVIQRHAVTWFDAR